jgi:hypothetical protein
MYSVVKHQVSIPTAVEIKTFFEKKALFLTGTVRSAPGGSN